MNNLSAEEQAAASVVASLSGKRERGDSPDAAGGCAKKSRAEDELLEIDVAAAAEAAAVAAAAAAGMDAGIDPGSFEGEELKPYPFFYYKDYSTQEDADPLTPLTPPGRVPNFVAKMHAILSRPDLADIITWMPHGRAWKVLKPREFEIRVIPTYFEHAKFSSFIRQANGWGFRRITSGKDRNCYYHPLFLRALPHLCKEMKRPGVAKKLAADPEHEPDLYQISEFHPVPESFEDDSILLHCTLQGGPRARMPIYSGSLSLSSVSLFPSVADNMKLGPEESKKAAAASITSPAVPQLTPRDQEALSSFQQSLGASEIHTMNSQANAPAASMMSANFMMLPQASALAQGSAPLGGVTLPANSVAAGSNKVSTLAAANQLALNPTMAAFQASSQFAAGFAAAAALSQQQFQSMLGSFAQQFANGINSAAATNAQNGSTPAPAANDPSQSMQD